MTKVETSEPRLARVWRGVCGALTVGLVLLALVVIGMQVYAGTRDVHGPGAEMILGHVVAAALAVVAQVVADRTRGWVMVAGGGGVVLVAAATLWSFWWA